MLITIPDVLTVGEVAQARAALDAAEWVDGKVTAGYQAQSVKENLQLPAGHMVLYPATSLHRVAPVTRGARVASFFWVQSMIRTDGDRTLLYDLDTAIQRLAVEAPGNAAGVQLTGVYHNLLRRWAEM